MSDRKQYFRELRKWYLDAGICFNCKTRPVVEGETRCLICKMDNRTKMIGYYAKLSANKRREHNAKCNARKERLKAAGLCVDCRRPVENGRTRCGICLAKDRARHKQQNIDAGKIPQELRANGTYCNMCCEPLCNGKKLCPTCYKKACDALEIARAKVDRDNHPWRKLINADVQRVRANNR